MRKRVHSLSYESIDVDIRAHAKVFRLDSFECGRMGKSGRGIRAGFVSQCTKACDVLQKEVSLVRTS